jgi:hypothetical protein
MRKFVYYGEINFTIDNNHPDIKCVENWTEDKVFTFSDTYYFDECYTKEEITDYIKRDLKLVAGGGYNANHIHNVKFVITQK